LSIRPLWATSITASGRSASGHPAQWVATSWLASAPNEKPSRPTGAPNSARAQPISAASSFTSAVNRSIVPSGARPKNASPAYQPGSVRRPCHGVTSSTTRSPIDARVAAVSSPPSR